ncbi:MAG: hypothetical protein MI725_11905 [Pirellulales bacterium]|nr:hypothetical protein [Pirellulales bacterium]
MRHVRALAWEFCANSWQRQLVAIVGVVGFASLVYGMFSRSYDLSLSDSEAGTSLHFGFFWVTLFFLGAPILAAWGVPQRRYTLPASSMVIVASSMVCSMVSMFVSYALTATSLNTIYDAGWPIWTPGLVAAFAVAWLQAILWSTSNSLGLQAMVSLASLFMLVFGVERFASPGQSPSGIFHEGPNALQALTFGLASLACVAVGTVGFAKLRHGGGINVERIVGWTCRLFPKSARSIPFSSPTAAQLWFEWTERGYAMPAGTAIMGFGVIAMALFGPVPHLIDFLQGISAVMFLPIIAVVGLLSGSRSGNGEFGSFNGSRPLTDSQIANAILASVTGGVFLSALVWAVSMGAAFIVVVQRTSSISIQGASEQFGVTGLLEMTALGLGIATLGIGVLWGVGGLMATIVLAGRRVGSTIVIVFVGGWILGGVGSALLTGEVKVIFQRVLFFAYVVLPLVCSAAAFVACWNLKLISGRTLVLAASIVAIMFSAAYLAGLTGELNALLPALWGCCLIPFALAGAPLAVWWNRHR